MRNLSESILDDEDKIMNHADKAADKTASAYWIAAKMSGGRVQGNSRDAYDEDTGTWRQPNLYLTIRGKDTIPDYVRISELDSIEFIGYNGNMLPEFGLKSVKRIIIRNCPNLKSLDNCPQNDVEVFAVSGCPKLTSLQGCPKKVSKMFKAVNNGKDFTSKDIKRLCNTPKERMIY